VTPVFPLVPPDFVCILGGAKIPSTEIAPLGTAGFPVTAWIVGDPIRKTEKPVKKQKRQKTRMVRTFLLKKASRIYHTSFQFCNQLLVASDLIFIHFYVLWVKIRIKIRILKMIITERLLF
jgi:hypothetical protein